MRKLKTITHAEEDAGFEDNRNRCFQKMLRKKGAEELCDYCSSGRRCLAKLRRILESSHTGSNIKPDKGDKTMRKTTGHKSTNKGSRKQETPVQFMKDLWDHKGHLIQRTDAYAIFNAALRKVGEAPDYFTAKRMVDARTMGASA